MKGRLAEAGVHVPKIHNLTNLLRQSILLEPLWASFTGSMSTMNNYAVHFRYPGAVATRDDAKTALKICRSFRLEARRALGLSAK